MINLSLPSGAMTEDERETALSVGKPLTGVIDQLPIDPELDEPVIPDRYLISMPAVEITIAIRTLMGLDIYVFIRLLLPGQLLLDLFDQFLQRGEAGIREELR